MEQNPYGATGPWQATPPASDPRAAAAWRQATVASLLQLLSPFVFSGMLLAGLVWEIPIAGEDPHGYVQIFGFFGSLVLLLVMVILAALAVWQVSRRNAAGAVLLLIVAGVAALESLVLATGMPGGIGELAPVRVATIAVGVVWLLVSAWCVVAGVRALAAIRD